MASLASATSPGSILLAFAVCMATGVPTLQAQTRPTLPPTNQQMFAPLELPDPTGVRSPTGEPGYEYWQQTSDYEIRVRLDPEAHRVSGSEVISYTNNSPEALEFLWIQLEQNLFSPDSRGDFVNSGSRWRGSFPGGGLELTKVEVVQDGGRYTPGTSIDDTRIRVDLASALAPSGGEVQIEFEWSFLVPEYGADRMGRFNGEDGWVYELAQWYPRMYVYDDLDGWNPMPYLGQGEFYLDYGDFDVEITVPRDFIVVAGGLLTNPGEVFTADQQRQWERASSSDETVVIVGADDIGTPSHRPSGSGELTWKYRLENARDFSWAASRAFILDGASWDGTLLLSAYPREGIGTAEAPGWERSTEYLLHTIPFYSEQWFRYPYPVAVNVAGVVGGMEYPGIVFCSVQARGQGLFGVTDHEFGHTWFPMIVGSDERRYAWMDEGFNTFLNHYSNLAFYGDGAQRAARTGAPNITAQMLAPISDQPIETQPDLLRREGLGFMAYRKPGYGLILLREVVLGPERFDAAFRSYIDNWAFKHPKPADFYRSMEEVSGEQLSWFWRGWFRTTELLDQAIEGVESAEGSTRIRLTNREGLVMPTHLRIELADGSVVEKRLPAEIWARSDEFTLELTLDGVPVKVSLDPAGMLPDVDRTNDVWVSRPVS